MAERFIISKSLGSLRESVQASSEQMQIQLGKKGKDMQAKSWKLCRIVQN